MRPIRYAFTPEAANTTGFLAGATGAGPFTPSSPTSGDNLAHLFTIISGDDLSAITFTVTGFDADGNVQTEAIVGPNATTATSTNYWSSITSVTASATLDVNTADFGWSGESVTKSIILSYINQNFFVGIGVTVTGTINWTLQHTFSDVFDKTGITYNWWDHDTLVGQTGSADGNYAINLIASRLKINSVTAGATVVWEMVQGSGTN